MPCTPVAAVFDVLLVPPQSGRVDDEHRVDGRVHQAVPPASVATIRSAPLLEPSGCITNRITALASEITAAILNSGHLHQAGFSEEENLALIAARPIWLIAQFHFSWGASLAISSSNVGVISAMFAFAKRRSASRRALSGDMLIWM